MTATCNSGQKSAPAPPVDPPWTTLVPDDQWAVFVLGTDVLQTARVPFLVHGAFALADCTGHWRNTKDIDVVVRPDDRERAIGALREAGFDDYFAREAYDRSWIFRGFRQEVLFDVFWDLPNHRVTIDDAWFQRALPLSIRGRTFSLVPVEELVRIKLYVFQRERCDWVDVLNVLATAGERIDWHWLVERIGRDLPLLQAVLALFNWMSPNRAGSIPAWLRARFALSDCEVSDPSAAERRRVRLFDSRPWFAPHEPEDRPLER